MTNDGATVAVVGAGLSGLVAARELSRAGVEVCVLEAADRVGGRALAQTSALGSRLDLGGQWIGHDHHRLRDLTLELGLTPFVMTTPRMPAIVEGGRRVSAVGPSTVVAALALVAVPIAPAGAGATVGSLLRRVPGRRARRLLEVAALISWTADPDRVSVRTMRALIRVQGGLRNMLSTRGGAQDSLIVEGAGTLAERLAAELGGRVRTGCRVVSIARDADGATLRTESGELRAAKVIITPPPPMAARIEHEPPLPPGRVALEQNSYMGTVYKAIAVYERPFWRARTSAEALILDRPGRAVFDTSPPDGPGHLCTLVGGDEACELDGMDAEARREALLGPLAGLLGDEVLEPASWHEKAWHRDEHVGGGYIALPEPGAESVLEAVPVPAETIGPLHWAGAETAADHPGYLDGAIEAGQRAAREVLGALAGGAGPA